MCLCEEREWKTLRLFLMTWLKEKIQIQNFQCFCLSPFTGLDNFEVDLKEQGYQVFSLQN